MDNPKVNLLKNLSIIAFVIFVGWHLANEIMQTTSTNPPNITETPEYKTLHANMQKEAQPLLDSLEQLNKIETELGSIFNQILEKNDETLQYKAGNLKSRYQVLMTKLTDKVGIWKTRNAAIKNHSEMTMESIKADFENLSAATTETTFITGEIMVELRTLLAEFKE